MAIETSASPASEPSDARALGEAPASRWRGAEVAEGRGFTYGWESAGARCHHAYVLPALEGLLPGAGALDILDLGCGAGYLTDRLARLGHRVVGVDPAEDGIALARAAYPGLRFALACGYDDLRWLTPEGGFDVVVACEVIEHVHAPARLLANVRRHLRPGGTIVVSTPYHGYLKNLALALAGAWDRHLAVHWEGGHIKFFSVRSLTRMLEDAGFEAVTFRFAGRLPLLWKSMIARAERPR